MKQHKDKGVWSHKPDALPLEDAPSTGTKRKKGPLARLSKKHLWDLLNQEKKSLVREVDRLFIWGTPKDTEGFGGMVYGWALDCLETKAETMDGLIQELEGRMD